MAPDIVPLKAEHHEDVKALCKTIWEGHDYVPEAFPRWMEDPNYESVGIFDDGNLVAIGTLEIVPKSTIGWVVGLRVREGYRDRGFAKDIVTRIIGLAKERGINPLWYATSSRNEASIHVATNLGFREVNSAGYFRLHAPYPPHQKPSAVFVPMTVDPDRLVSLLEQNPELVSTSTIPAAWEFEFADREGLHRLVSKTHFRVVMDENGVAQAFFFKIDRQREEESTAAFTIFATDRSVFVDVLARTIDEAQHQGADRAVYFLGPRCSEWVMTTGFVAEEFIGRRFLLYEIHP